MITEYFSLYLEIHKEQNLHEGERELPTDLTSDLQDSTYALFLKDVCKPASLSWPVRGK